MLVYAAGKFSAQARLREEARLLEDLDPSIEVVSSWLWSTEPDEAPPEARAGYAERDLGEIREADVLILDTLDESNTGGREVELGYAIATGKKLSLVGPPRNVFHNLLKGQYASWDELRSSIQSALSSEPVS